MKFWWIKDTDLIKWHQQHWSTSPRGGRPHIARTTQVRQS